MGSGPMATSGDATAGAGAGVNCAATGAVGVACGAVPPTHAVKPTMLASTMLASVRGQETDTRAEYTVDRSEYRPNVTRTSLQFGYNPPTGTRQIERFDGATFSRDLQGVLEVAAQHFSSLWVSDHLMTVEPWRMDVWTQLTWMAARFPGPLLGTIVMANSYRHPPLMAKMAASLQLFSQGRFVLGYGAGWHAAEYRAYGYEFPSTRVRIAQMVEGLEVMKAMWTQSPATYEGDLLPGARRVLRAQARSVADRHDRR